MALALKARRTGAKNSMAIGIDLVKNGEADVFVTAGNTGACVASSYFRLGMIEGVDLPALVGPFPTATGICLVLDIGANPNCKPINLQQFAIMGSVYAEKVRGVQNPRIGLIANGEEAGKGSELVKESYPLLEAAKINFIGNVEGKEIFNGHADVAVTDGFTGNVFLKATEAVAKLLVEKIRETIKGGNLPTKIGGMLVRPALGSIRKTMDPSEEGAAPLLGVNGLVFISHGRSDAIAIKSSVRVAKIAAEAKVLDAMKECDRREFEEIRIYRAVRRDSQAPDMAIQKLNENHQKRKADPTQWKNWLLLKSGSPGGTGHWYVYFPCPEGPVHLCPDRAARGLYHDPDRYVHGQPLWSPATPG